MYDVYITSPGYVYYLDVAIFIDGKLERVSTYVPKSTGEISDFFDTIGIKIDEIKSLHLRGINGIFPQFKAFANLHNIPVDMENANE